ncbi:MULTISPECIES: EFR1 family ferrodoxin [unclassified Butyrivibrio]|uniref:EFR1 family ferrodoxin n=1 Tax=unclassified Butyrivibrio TaxID=2639466 RepID=UPI00041B550D|nr:MULTISPECIES: EFR1 family ferrodoxin [unclassified Butyrivibrio]
MIVFFTGTGNSRFIAEKLAEFTGDETFDIFESVRTGKGHTFTEEGPYIFIAPVYVAAPAQCLTDFIKRSEFPKNSKAYFIMCCAASMSASPVFCMNIASEKGFEYKGTAPMIMPQNYITYFKADSEEICRDKIKNAPESIREISEYIKAGKDLPQTKISNFEYRMTVPVLNLYCKYFMKSKAFHVTDKCIGCGKCVSLCPFGNISLKDNKPVWGSKCTHCMACISMCPTEAIEYGKLTKGKPRYHGPYSYNS